MAALRQERGRDPRLGDVPRAGGRVVSMTERQLLARTAELAADFLERFDERPVHEQATPEELHTALGSPLHDEPSRPAR